MSETRARAPARFCAAPWLESVLYNDGSYRICSRNHRVFGDWRKESLESTWGGPELQAFRRSIAEGKYPDVDCASCHQAGTYQSLERILTTPVRNTLSHLVELGILTQEEKAEWMALENLFRPDAASPLEGVGQFRDRLDSLRGRMAEQGRETELVILKKLENVLGILDAYWSGNPNPPVVGPFRQVQLVAKCNARCVMCPGKFTGEIMTGTAISAQELPRVMAQSDHIVDFFCNGSEFLLFREWRDVALALKSGGVASLRLSTNGILLSKNTVEYLVDNRLIGHLNVSMNAGTKDTLERVQKNVRWDLLQSNIHYLLEYAESKKHFFPLSFSFIVMRSNFHELPAFLGLVAEWKAQCKTLNPHVMIMSLENSGAKDYRYFLYEEHLSFAPRGELENAFREAARIAEEHKIVAPLYNFGAATHLADFVVAGFPVPDFSSHPETDRENIEIHVRKELDGIFGPVLLKTKETMARGIRSAAERGEPYPAGDAYEEARALMQQDSIELARRLSAPSAAPSEFRNLFTRFPEHEKYYGEYRAEWRKVLQKRFFEATEAQLWSSFREHFGWERESLGDHYGEKYARVPVNQMALGARVLCADYQIWNLAYRSDTQVYLERDGVPPIETSPDFVLGAFAFEPRPDAERAEENARRLMTYFSEESSRRKNKQDPAGALREIKERLGHFPLGLPVLGTDGSTWHYLTQRASTVYLLHPDGKTLRVAPQYFLLGAALPNKEIAPSALEKALRRAELHWRVNSWKRKILGQRKSKVLWQLSRLYRLCLRCVGIETPPDLVI